MPFLSAEAACVKVTTRDYSVYYAIGTLLLNMEQGYAIHTKSSPSVADYQPPTKVIDAKYRNSTIIEVNFERIVLIIYFQANTTSLY